MQTRRVPADMDAREASPLALRFAHWVSTTVVTPLAIVIMASIALRLPGVFLSTGHGFDHWTMQVWTRALVDAPLTSFYSLDLDVPQDHLPGDLFIFAGLGHALTSIMPDVANGNYPDPRIIKGVAVLADLMIGAMIYGISRKLATRRIALIAMSGFILSPGVLYVSSIWGQWDAVSSAFAIGAIFLAIRGSRGGMLSWPLLAYACLIKPQYGLIAPFLLLFFWKQDGWSGMRQSATGIVAGLGLVQLVSSLFDIGLPGVPTRWALIDRIRASVDEYDAISLNGHNIWILPIGRGAPFSDQDQMVHGLTFQTFGTLLFIVAALTIFGCAAQINDHRAALLWGSTATMFAMFVTMTRMHERYLFPVLPLIVVAAVLIPRLRLPAVVVHVAYLFNVHVAYMNGHSGPGLLQNDIAYQLNGLLIIGTFLWVVAVGVREAGMTRHRREHFPKGAETLRPSARTQPIPDAPGVRGLRHEAAGDQPS